MKRILLALATCIPLGGCFGSGDTPDISTGPDAFAIWNTVRQATQAYCRFDPDFQTVSEFIAQGGQFQIPDVIGRSICNAVSKPMLKSKAGVVITPTVNGVAIRGRRV